jgi:hypothetical protein
MATINLSVKYRPVRIGFLVRDQVIDDVVKAAGLSTLLCGGIRNPIIPVGTNRSAADYLIQLFSVDVLVAVSQSAEIKALMDANPFLRSPHDYGNGIFHEDWHTKKNVPAYVDIINIVDLWWEKEIRHKAEDFKSNCVLVRWMPEDPIAHVFAVQFGYYPTEHDLLGDFNQAFVRGLKAKEMTISLNGHVDEALTTHITPIKFTGLELDAHNGWRRDGGIYVGDEDNFADLVTFWNLRASGSGLFFFPKKQMVRFKRLLEEYFSELDRRKPANLNLMDSVAVCYLDGSESEALDICNTFKTTKPKALTLVHEVGGIAVPRPAEYYYDAQQTLANVDQAYGRPVVTLGLPNKLFLSPRGYPNDRQHLVVSLDFHSELDFPNHTLKPPFLRQLNEFYSREVAFDPWTIRVERQGLAYITDCGDASIRVYPLPHQKLIETVFEAAGVKTRMSQPGLLADQIIKSMRETAPLEACRVFKVRGVRKLFRELSEDAAIKWNDALRVIGTEQFSRFKDLYIESRDHRDLEPGDVLTFLIKKRILRPRLNFLERVLRRRQLFKCRGCGLGSNLLMATFESAWVCPFCRLNQFLPEYIGVVFNNKAMWRFQKSGLFAKDNNQEGAVPVVLSLLAFARILDPLVYSTALDFPLEKNSESDLCVLQYHFGEDVEIGIGECKSDGGRITEAKVCNLKTVRGKLQGFGLETYLVFARTTDAFSPEEIELFRGLVGERVPVILFTNGELEPYDPYWRSVDKGLPLRHPLTLADMARNSEVLYLRANS